jgi:hypothetical protein
MNYDQNKKTLRQFQCRDYLWDIFEQMSGELECSVDYLVNEAMRQYARSRNYGHRTPGMPQGAPSSPRTAPPAIPSAPPPPHYAGEPAAPAPSHGPGAYGSPAPPSPGFPSAGPPAYPGAAAGPPPLHAPASAPAGPPQGYGGGPPPLPGGGYGAPAASPGPVPLFIVFNGQRLPVSKEEFIIGRGSKTADLPIKDGNISRRHAALIWQGGAWVIKDLGSTNGVEYRGRKIDSKRIEEGDVFQLCDYELRFTYQI